MILSEPVNKKSFYDCQHINFGETMVKMVVDINREVLAYDAEWHADLETELLADGSMQRDLWGFNYYPDNDIIEYNSLINIKPLVNKSTDILDKSICERIEHIFYSWLNNE